MSFTLRARVVFPVDRPPVEDGAVTVGSDGRILWVGPAKKNVDGPARDLGDVALLPGFVNAHTHLEFSELAQPLGSPTIPMAEWIRRVLVQRRHRTTSPHHAIAAGVRESLSHGTTTLGEIATADAPAYADLPPLDLTLFLEVIGFSRVRAESVLQSTLDRLNAFIDLHVGLSPHAPYTVSPDLVTQLVELASRRHLPVAMHLAESTDELELLARGTGPFRELLEERSMWDPTAIPLGTRPLDYLQLLAHTSRALVVHGNYLSEVERSFLATHADHMSLVYCPRTHARFGHPPYPLAELLAAGVRVALGTDSRASNPDLSVLSELRHAAQQHKSISPGVILFLGTLAGAHALGCEADCGSITPRKWAQLVAVPLSSQRHTAATEVLNDVFAGKEAPHATWVHGNEVATTE